MPEGVDGRAIHLDRHQRTRERASRGKVLPRVESPRRYALKGYGAILALVEAVPRADGEHEAGAELVRCAPEYSVAGGAARFDDSDSEEAGDFRIGDLRCASGRQLAKWN